MASILKSQTTLEERARDCGLTQTELDVLVRKGITSLSLLAFSVSTPGEVPQEPRSTSQPFHIIRRLIKLAEATGQSFYTVLLDREKAFNKTHPGALLTALERFGVPSHLTALMKTIYTSPQFTVGAASKQSKSETQAGIRRGCPLSPYLFLIVHGMVMHDVDKELTANGEFLPWLYSQNQPSTT